MKKVKRQVVYKQGKAIFYNSETQEMITDVVSTAVKTVKQVVKEIAENSGLTVVDVQKLPNVTATYEMDLSDFIENAKEI